MSGSSLPTPVEESPWGFPAVDPADAGFDPRRLQRIDRWVDSYVDSGRLAGMSFALLRDGRVVHARAAGVADLERGAPLAPDTLHRIYSMTKPVTGVAMMILFERGLFQLDDPVGDLLPELAEVRVQEGNRSVPAQRPISLRHLLTHTAGLTYGFLDTDATARRMREGGLDAVPGQIRSRSLEQWCRDLARLPLVAHPGTRWHYSVAMDVLGRVVEVLSEVPFDEFVRTEILEPLAMADTDFHVPEERRGRLATCYRLGGAGIHAIERRHNPFLEPPDVPLGGGGLVSTLPDYLRFAEMLRRGGALDGVRILSPAAVELMTTDHLHTLPLAPEHRAAPVASLAPMRTFRGEGFGLTGMVSLDPAASGILGPPGQFAWGGAASTSFWIDRALGITAVQMAQLLPSSAYPLRPEARNVVYQALMG